MLAMHTFRMKVSVLFSLNFPSITDRISAAMNLSHVINEFSFGPYFPDITQPLDNSFEITPDRK